jgi:hypothetical protein
VEVKWQGKLNGVELPLVLVTVGLVKAEEVKLSKVFT